MTAMLIQRLKSNRVMRRLRRFVRRRLLAKLAPGSELSDRVDLVYRYYVGRPADAQGLASYVAALRDGMSFAQLKRSIETSPEASSRAEEKEREFRDYVSLIYRHWLGRKPDANGLLHYLNELRKGVPFSKISAEVRESDEATFRRQLQETEFVQYVTLIYQHWLGRTPDNNGLLHYANELRSGAPLSEIAARVKASDEALSRMQSREAEAAKCVNLVYKHWLGRSPDAYGLLHYTNALRNGVPLSRISDEIQESPEAKSRGLNSDSFDVLSDGEFILNVAELLFEGRGATASDIEHYRKILNENRAKRDDLVRSLVGACADRRRRGERFHWDSQNCWIMGTDRYVTPGVWQQRASEIGATSQSSRQPKPPKPSGGFQHSGEYAVSAIASLYKGGRFIEKFLDNITSQTLFDRSELIIIDADSPEREADVIAEYQKNYPNIVYKRINYRIGVYDAWNVGVQIARGRYLTNTNLDDLRRCDSFELQASALDQWPSVDVVYQDFFYSFDSSLTFEEVASFGFKSGVPIVTPNNLIVFNSPHNAPMWRKKLHDEMGLFDTLFKSAGDWEFWLRCLHSGKVFHKINTPHVAYFQNPDGLSTRADTRGVEEGREVLRRYSRKMLSPNLLMSREKFVMLVGATDGSDAEMSYYDIVQSRLVQLGAERKASNVVEVAELV